MQADNSSIINSYSESTYLSVVYSIKTKGLHELRLINVKDKLI